MNHLAVDFTWFHDVRTIHYVIVVLVLWLCFRIITRRKPNGMG